MVDFVGDVDEFVLRQFFKILDELLIRDLDNALEFLIGCKFLRQLDVGFIGLLILTDLFIPLYFAFDLK